MKNLIALLRQDMQDLEIIQKDLEQVLLDLKAIAKKKEEAITFKSKMRTGGNQ